ncbi:MAG: hypothetical protein ACYC2T_13240 [Bacillota bacterium]
MISYRELRTLSLDFRRTSSNLLNSDDDNADVNMRRFKIFIHETPFINQVLHNVMDGVDYDFRKCFHIEDSGWHSIEIPVNEKLHIKAQYDYMTFIIENDRCSVADLAMRFPHTSDRWVDIIQSFINDAFKPLIDYINDAISKEIILLEEEQKQTPSMVQNIGSVYGSAVQGFTITSTNVTNVNDNEKLIEMLGQAINALAYINAPEDIKADLQDDIEVVSEQIASPTPKKNRLNKALAGIKKFAAEFGMKVAVSTAAGAVTGFNWHKFIQIIETFVDKSNS